MQSAVVRSGTGKSHVLIGVAHRAVEQGLRERYGGAADLVEQLYRGLADNTVSRVIDNLLRNDVVLIDEVGFAPLDETDTQLLFRLVAPRPTQSGVV
ncbi:MAG: ATP-binding protein [Chloroflexi bacterium]|nr:ATP-binding protein [Chloroflexota bacterium]